MNLPLLNKLHETLPESGIGHFTMDHVDFLQKVLEDTNPKVIWEFGFNTGHSSAIWLALTDAKVYAVDPSTEYPTLRGALVIKENFGDRFSFLNVSSRHSSIEVAMNIHMPDLLLVDGDHSYVGCKADLDLAARLKVKHILIDNLEDYIDVRPATENFLEENPEYVGITEGRARNIITWYIKRK
jgi:hypothetical protein